MKLEQIIDQIETIAGNFDGSAIETERRKNYVRFCLIPADDSFSVDFRITVTAHYIDVYIEHSGPVSEFMLPNTPEGRQTLLNRVASELES